MDYPRDLVGYGPKPPKAKWPGSARVALQFVLNYEEGGENSILHGDKASEAFLSEIVGAQPLEGVRHMSMESIYEYGSRVGVWRLLELFARYDLPLTVFGVAMAMERNPAVVEAFLKAGHEVASHGWRWINYQYVPLEVEREHMQRAIEIHRGSPASARSAGTPAAPARTRAAWWSRTAASSTTPTTTTTTCPGTTPATASRSSSCPTRWTRTTCASPRAQGFNSGDDFFTLPEGQLRRAVRRGAAA